MRTPKVFFAILISALSTYAFGQNGTTAKWGVGFHLNEWGNDFGIGGSVTTPFFFNIVAIDIGYFETFNSNSPRIGAQWEPYGIIDFGVRSKAGQLTPWFHMYGFGRVSFVVGYPEEWTVDSPVSGVGGFGFEFNTHTGGLSPVSYFIELGGRGGFDIGFAEEPSTAGGFHLSTGLRAYF